MVLPSVTRLTILNSTHKRPLEPSQNMLATKNQSKNTNIIIHLQEQETSEQTANLKFKERD